LLPVGSVFNVRNVSGETIESSPSLSYLGATLAADGRVGSKLSRHLGAAKTNFRGIRQVWNHTSLTRGRKLEIYRALIEAKLLYGLSSACFTKAELRRLDGFQSKCLRTVLGVAPSYYSRVSNLAVLRQASWERLSTQLQRRRLTYLGKVLRAEEAHPLRTCSMVPGTDTPLTHHYIRRVGRPRKEWLSSLLPAAHQIAGGLQRLQGAVQQEMQWKRAVRNAVL
jgi:hypothetical protein